MTIRLLPDLLRHGADRPTRRRVTMLDGTPEGNAHARDWERLVARGLIGPHLKTTR